MSDCDHEVLKCMSCMRQGDLGYFIDQFNTDLLDVNDLPANYDLGYPEKELWQATQSMHMEDEFDARSEVQDEAEKDSLSTGSSDVPVW